MANKIKYGIKNVYYAVATLAANNSATFGTPVALPGAVSLTLDPEGDNNIFYADNIAYYTSYANNGYSGSLELALIPDAFRKDVLGEIEDNKDVLVEEQGAPSVHFALMFQFEGDVKATRHVMYNCVASRPTTNGSTKEASIEPQTETINLTATSIYNAALDKDIVKARTGDSTDNTAYTGWFTQVYVPTGVST
ncbi:MAG: phage tail protein [Ruminococcus sp.]|nr:phage tail protein [Ruminococcus sp.]